MQSQHDAELDRKYMETGIYLCKWCGQGTRGYPGNPPLYRRSGHTGNIISVQVFCCPQCAAENEQHERDIIAQLIHRGRK